MERTTFPALEQLNQTIYDFYDRFGRHDLPWRINRSPFTAFLSEIMLQQTQVPRVVEKFTQFMERFDGFESLAAAPQHEIVRLWQGLGYNRRALYLHRSAQMIVTDFGGTLPDLPEQLIVLPGIGPATAASITVYAYNRPIPFIETNVRSVFIHHLFQDSEIVKDSEILPLVSQALDRENPYRWYSALMDYGTMLKATMPNPSRKSRHHVRQSRFEGSRRQVRGRVIRLLSELSFANYDRLIHFLNDPRAESVVETLIREELVLRKGKGLSLA